MVAKHVLEELSRSFILSEHAVQSSVSIGISLYPQDGQDGETLVRNADLAMYQAKESGRNDFRFYSPSSEQHTAEPALLGAAAEMNPMNPMNPRY